MEKQQTFTDMEYAGRKRVSRREAFLETMNRLVPWQRLEEKIRPHYFAGKRGRPPKGIQLMLRMYLPRVWFSLADEAVEEQIYGSYAMRKFMGIDFTEEGVPDAAVIETPSSAKNSAKSRDPEMRQCKKGNEWHFGMKAHIGADEGSGMAYSVETTAANAADIAAAHKLIRADDEFVNAEGGICGDRAAKRDTGE
jgi:IS5 family transposase